MTKLTLYTKQDCSLCDEALAVLERVRGSVPFELEQVDITSDDTLRARYGERIPVVAVDGVPLFELHVDERRLEELLDRDTPSAANGQAAKAAS